jgi:hypothetical protein
VSAGKGRDGAQDDLPQRDPGATLDPPDRAQLIINRESVRAAYDEKDGNR